MNKHWLWDRIARRPEVECGRGTLVKGVSMALGRGDCGR